MRMFVSATNRRSLPKLTIIHKVFIAASYSFVLMVKKETWVVSLLGGGEQTGPQGDDGKVSMGAYCVMEKVVEMEDL